MKKVPGTIFTLTIEVNIYSNPNLYVQILHIYICHFSMEGETEKKMNNSKGSNDIKSIKF